MPSATPFIKMSVFHQLLFPLAWLVFRDDGARRSNRRWLADVTPAFPSIRDASGHDIVARHRGGKAAGGIFMDPLRLLTEGRSRWHSPR